jgi:hypothetical protein
VPEQEFQPSAGVGGPGSASAPSSAKQESSDHPRPDDAPTPSEAALPGSASEASAPTSDLTYPEEQRVFQALTAADERQIIAEIEGRALGAMVYSFPSEGGKATGLSWKGVQEAVRQMNTRNMGRIKIAKEPAPAFEEITIEVDTGNRDDDGQPVKESRRAVRCTVYGEDGVFGSARFGTATQLRDFKSKKKDKHSRPIWFSDSFADAKALSKAQRNALEGMLPLELVEELKAAYIGKGSVEYIDAVAVDVTEMPPALDDEKAKVLGDEIRAMYATFKKVHPEGMKAMPPAEFNRYFVAAQHSHDRLADFMAHMGQRVDEARKAAEAKKEKKTNA